MAAPVASSSLVSNDVEIYMRQLERSKSAQIHLQESIADLKVRSPTKELGMLILVFWQTGFRLLKIGFKPFFGFTGLHRNYNFKHS